MDLSNARPAIEETGRRFGTALIARDFQTVAALYTEDAELLPPDSPIIAGRPAIAGFWQQAVAALGVTSATFQTREVISSGELAVEIGSVAIGTSGGLSHLKYMVAWQRGQDGVWRLHRDIWNAMPA